MYVYDVFLALLHAHLLLAERTEKVLHESPVEERAVLVHPRYLQVSEVAHLAKRMLSSGNRTFVLVKIDKHLQLIAGLDALWYVT